MLETARLRLRAWKEEDYEPFARLNADPEVMEFFPSRLSLDESNAFANRSSALIVKNGYGLWAVEQKSTGQFIGYIGLHEPTFEAPFMPCMEIGWRLTRASWGNGFAPEGAKAALDFAFTVLKKTEIVSFTAVENHKSRRVMEKIGMTRDNESDFDHPKLPIGHALRRHVLYRISQALI